MGLVGLAEWPPSFRSVDRRIGRNCPMFFNYLYLYCFAFLQS